MSKPPSWLFLVFCGILFLFPVNLSLESQPELLETKFIVSNYCLKGIVEPIYYKVQVLGTRIITAYNSEPTQTDSTPFITASNQQVRDGIIATNELPFGTIIEIDGKVYEVQDRTNKRYQYRYDIWMKDKKSALEFGKKVAEIKIIY